MKTYNLIIIGAASLAAAAMVASCGRKHTSQDAQRPPMDVDVAMVTVDSVVIHKTYPGYLVADKKIDIVGRVNGYLTGKFFNDGQWVKKGTVLFTIEDTQYRDQLQQAQAQLSTALATNDYATRQYNAMKKAYESEAVSQMDVVQAESNMNQSLASIESARAAVQTATTTLSYCTVTAPCDGHVAAPAVTVGDYIAGGGSPVRLATIYDDDYVSSVIAIEDAQYMAILDNRQRGDIRYDSIPVTFNDTLPHRYSGTLTYVAPDVSTGTGTLELKVKIMNPLGELKAGMYSLVHLPVATDPHAVMVLDQAVGTDQRGAYVYTVNDSCRVEYTPVTLGETIGDSLRIVTSGLKPTDRYVTRALLKVRQGMEVNPVMSH